MNRCALFVDAGYLLADGAMAVHGTRGRNDLAWDYDGLVRLLGELARERTGLPLLRCYWYEPLADGRRADGCDALTGTPGVKVRFATARPGRRDGAQAEMRRDLATLARNGAVADAVVVSVEDDLAQVVADVQALGVRVALLTVAVDGQPGAPGALRDECDDLVELTGAHLRPYVVASTAGTGGRGGEYAVAAAAGGRNGVGRAAAELTGTDSGGHDHRSFAGRSEGHGREPSGSASRPEAVDRGLTAARDGAYGHDRGGSASASRGDPVDRGSFAGTDVYGAPVPASQRPPRDPTAAGSGADGARSPAPRYLDQPAPASDRSGGPPPPDPRSARPRVPQQNGSAGWPPGDAPGRQPAPAPVSLPEAVRSARDEGEGFGASVARDAPVLWLEAVLARKPRMPSDLEARLLQGSALPIDFLLHDEVRGALQQGFWDALERSRR